MNTSELESDQVVTSTSTVVPNLIGYGPNILTQVKGAGIGEFDGRHYFTWRVKLGAIIRGSRELAGFLESGEVNAEKDQLLADMIVICLSGPLVNMYRSLLSSGKAMLARLDAEYNRKDVGSKHAALTRLLTYKYKGSGVQKHCDDVIQLMNDLSDTGLTLEHELMVCILLYSLPAELNTFVSTLCSLDSKDLTIDMIRVRAMAEEARMRVADVALPLMRKSQGKQEKQRTSSKRKPNEKVKCFRCKGPHFVKDCPEPKEDMAALAYQTVYQNLSEEAVPDAKRLKIDPMDVDVVEIKSYRSPLKEKLQVVKKIPETAGKIRNPKESDEESPYDFKKQFDFILDGKSWKEVWNERPKDVWLNWPSEKKNLHIKSTFPKFNENLPPTLRPKFRHRYWTPITEVEKKYFAAARKKAAEARKIAAAA